MVNFKRQNWRSQSVWRFDITPMPNIQPTEADREWRRIGLLRLEEMRNHILKYPDKYKDRQRLVTWVNDGYRRLLRFRKLKEYKLALRQMAIDNGFRIPDHPFAVIFYRPVPKSWSKKKKRSHHLEPMKSKPDKDNMYKSFIDAFNMRYTKQPRRDEKGRLVKDDKNRVIMDKIPLVPLIDVSDDKDVWCDQQAKLWVNAEHGYIEFYLQSTAWCSEIVKNKRKEEGRGE